MLESARLEVEQAEEDPDGSHHKEAEGFECEWAETMGVDYASCTGALMCAYLALSMGSGDEVIIPGLHIWPRQRRR